MIASGRGLVVLALVVCALLVVLVVDLARRDAPMNRTLVPGFDEASVIRLGWTAHSVGPYLTLERAKGGPFRRTAPAPGIVEQMPIQSLLATLRGARWHRSKERDPRQDSAAHLAVDHAGGRLELWIGGPIESSEQVWIGIGDRSYLVDAWVTRALTPSPLDLAITAPLASIASAPAYSIDGVRIEGAPRRLLPRAATSQTPSPTTPPIAFLLDPAFVGELERALAELVIEVLPRAPMKHSEVTTIEVPGTRVLLGGPCESRIYLAATAGDGCVSREKADAVVALVAKLPIPAAIVARAPVPVGVESVTLVDGATLDLRRRPTIDGADANLDEVMALMTVLRTPVDPSDVVVTTPTTPAPSPSTPAPSTTAPSTPAPSTPSPSTTAPSTIGTLSIGTGRDAITLLLHRGNLVAREGEPFALRLAPDAFTVLRRGATAYKELTPWREEPTTIDEITIDDVSWKRGAVLGEWTRTPAGPSDAASIDALVRALAEPRVLGVATATVVDGKRVRLVVRPPVGGEKSHTLVIGVARGAGCPAKIDTTTILLSVEICRLVPR
ncbi:MAG: hypothetical protein ACKV2T_42310 [Kofleriaceae bacterium]